MSRRITWRQGYGASRSFECAARAFGNRLLSVVDTDNGGRELCSGDSERGVDGDRMLEVLDRLPVPRRGIRDLSHGTLRRESLEVRVVREWAAVRGISRRR